MSLEEKLLKISTDMDKAPNYVIDISGCNSVRYIHKAKVEQWIDTHEVTIDSVSVGEKEEFIKDIEEKQGDFGFGVISNVNLSDYDYVKVTASRGGFGTEVNYFPIGGWGIKERVKNLLKNSSDKVHIVTSETGKMIRHYESVSITRALINNLMQDRYIKKVYIGDQIKGSCLKRLKIATDVNHVNPNNYYLAVLKNRAYDHMTYRIYIKVK